MIQSLFFLGLQLALQVAVAAQPLLNILAVTLEPADLRTDGVKALLNSAVEALKKMIQVSNYYEDIDGFQMKEKSLTLVSLEAKNCSTSFNCASVQKLAVVSWTTVPSMPRPGGRRL